MLVYNKYLLFNMHDMNIKVKVIYVNFKELYQQNKIICTPSNKTVYLFY